MTKLSAAPLSAASPPIYDTSDDTDGQTPPSIFFGQHRSLAALAGERDRALRSLAAEEDRRRDMVEELSGLLGGELSCGDVSRLAMGLERIEREQAAAGEGEGEGGGGGLGESRGRAWVLEVSWFPVLKGKLSGRILVGRSGNLSGSERRIPTAHIPINY